jgi:predicted dehydrogenase
MKKEGTMARENTIKVGVVGCGYWGPKLARNFVELPDAELAMICDLKYDRLEAVLEHYPEVEATKDFEKLLDANIDAVVLATPVYSHFPLAKKALEAGKHVLVEKPLTANSEQAQELIRLAEDRGLTLMVGHTYEYNPAVETVREIIKSGELGEIYYINSTRLNLGLLQPDINVMWDLAPHDISIIRYMLDADPTRVSARGACYVNTYKNLHEVVYLVMSFDDGLIANVQVSWLDPVKQRQITIVGSKKMLVYDDIAEDKIMIFDKGVEVPEYSLTEEEFHASYRHGEEKVYPFEWGEPLRKECSDFIQAIQTGSTPRSDGISGLKVVKVLETAQRSLLNGGVELKIEY